jgi:hypothetical protein
LVEACAKRKVQFFAEEVIEENGAVTVKTARGLSAPLMLSLP